MKYRKQWVYYKNMEERKRRKKGVDQSILRIRTYRSTIHRRLENGKPGIEHRQAKGNSGNMKSHTQRKETSKPWQ
jgi:hypothetical protein